MRLFRITDYAGNTALVLPSNVAHIGYPLAPNWGGQSTVTLHKGIPEHAMTGRTGGEQYFYRDVWHDRRTVEEALADLIDAMTEESAQ